MNIKVFKDYDEASFYCADLVASTINKNSHPILGLATGSSPLGVYQEIIRRYQRSNWICNVTHSIWTNMSVCHALMNRVTIIL